MKPPTLDQFLEAMRDPDAYPRNIHVRHPEWETLYIRHRRRFIDGKLYYPVLDLASLTAKEQGKGTFKKLVVYLREKYPHLHLYVESVLNEQFREGLVRMGFSKVVGEDSFFMPAKEETNA